MPEYSRDVFSKYSNEQLLTYIEQQNDQMGRLETRFRDVVRAYKGVLTEKDALEATVKALSISQEDDADSALPGEGDRPSDNETDYETLKSSTGDCVRSEGVRSDLSEAGDSGAETKPIKDHLSPSGGFRHQLKQQLSTVTAAMATLNVEKAKMESSFQEDKKAMVAQQDTLSRLLQTERDSFKRESKELRRQIEQMRESLISEQHSRQEEQETNAQMLRELQALIATERDHKKALNVELEELNRELYNVREQVSREKVHEYEELIQSISVELEQVKGQLAVAEKKHDPSPQILKLKQEMAAIKVECEGQVRTEQDKLTECEERLKLQAQHEEERVAGLEAKLSSLSETIGGYERLRENDQATTHRLKERVAQLDSENTALTKEHVEREGFSIAETAAQVKSLQEKLARLKALLKLATVRINDGAVLPANMEELSLNDYSDMLSSQPSGKEYKQELSQLKEEFERYKTRAQSVLKNRGGVSKDGESGGRELEEVRRVNDVLSREVETLRGLSEEAGQEHSQQLQALRVEMRDMDTRHRREAAETNSQYKSKLSELETQVQATRSRTLKLLKEKDTEIQKLRTELQTGGRGYSEYPMETKRQLSSQGSTSSLPEGGEEGEERGGLNLPIKGADSSNPLQELLDKVPNSPSVGGRRLLHDVQETAARDGELAIARRRRVELEDLNRDLVVREQIHFEQIGFLKGEIRKLGRDRSRETESMEYLKNIVMHYMCADSAGRDQLINPLATVLHFSQDEVSEVKRKVAARRWLSAAPK
ncbi:GRIP and coiled-coil domain-containing protein 1-like [Halichondria panicea]|uniref:GRIP and coiled-coil domain-containing protein 1-like n=1 Tax=Halichondria panicea TaxID=6063 RepID=UPI00312BB9BE